MPTLKKKKKKPTLCLNVVVAKGAEVGLINEGRYHLLLLHKQVHDKRGFAESLHVYINSFRLSVCVRCEVGVF